MWITVSLSQTRAELAATSVRNLVPVAHLQQFLGVVGGRGHLQLVGQQLHHC